MPLLLAMPDEFFMVHGTKVYTKRETNPGAVPAPTVADMASHLELALRAWTKAGFPTVTAEQYKERALICEKCPLWDGLARFGLGKCKACGCTGLKRWLATERCTHPQGSRWPALDAVP